MATELGLLTRVLRERWGELAGRTAIRAEDLDRAEELSERLARGFAARKRPSRAVAVATEERRRAFTLMVGTYDQARRAVMFLRWDRGDGDRIAPSLWKGRGGRKRAREGGTSPDPGSPIHT